MAGIGSNPLIFQGNLNRVLTHIVVGGNTALNVTASNMGQSQAQLTFEGEFNNQIPTATGIVNSPEPFVMAQIVISLLRSQTLANDWVAQAQLDVTGIGEVTAYPDSTAFQSIKLVQCSIQNIDPGAYDGKDAITKITVKGVFYTNSILWA